MQRQAELLQELLERDRRPRANRSSVRRGPALAAAPLDDRGEQTDRDQGDARRPAQPDDDAAEKGDDRHDLEQCRGQLSR
jgi:hypothetical protein